MHLRIMHIKVGKAGKKKCGEKKEDTWKFTEKKTSIKTALNDHVRNVIRKILKEHVGATQPRYVRARRLVFEDLRLCVFTPSSSAMYCSSKYDVQQGTANGTQHDTRTYHSCLSSAARYRYSTAARSREASFRGGNLCR